MIDLTIGFTAMGSISTWARDDTMSGRLRRARRAAHTPHPRQKSRGVNFRVVSTWCRLIGVDHIHAGTVVGKLEGDPKAIRGYYDRLREDFNPKAPERGFYFYQ